MSRVGCETPGDKSVDHPQGIPALYNASYIIQSAGLCGSARESPDFVEMYTALDMQQL